MDLLFHQRWQRQIQLKSMEPRQHPRQLHAGQRWTVVCWKKGKYFGNVWLESLCKHPASSRMKKIWETLSGACCWNVLSFTVLPYSMIPDLDGPVCTAGDENTWVEVVPLDSVHRHVVSIIRLQQLLGVGFGALREQMLWLKYFYLSMFSDWASGISQFNSGPGSKMRSCSNTWFILTENKLRLNYCKFKFSYTTPSLCD